MRKTHNEMNEGMISSCHDGLLYVIGCGLNDMISSYRSSLSCSRLMSSL